MTTTLLVDTPQKMSKRLDELQRPEIEALKLKSSHGSRMADIILQNKFSIDTDYQDSDNGEPPHGKN